MGRWLLGSSHLLSTTERVHIDRKRLDRDGIEPPAPGRHDARAAITDRLDQRLLVRAVQPNVVRQIRRASSWLPLAFSPWQAAQLSAKILAPAAASKVATVDRPDSDRT